MRRENSKRKQKRAMADANRRLSKQNKSRGADATWEGEAPDAANGVDRVILSPRAASAGERAQGRRAPGRAPAADRGAGVGRGRGRRGPRRPEGGRRPALARAAEPAPTRRRAHHPYPPAGGAGALDPNAAVVEAGAQERHRHRDTQFARDQAEGEQQTLSKSQQR